jgi:Na+/melibiose symporter-like transporter
MSSLARTVSVPSAAAVPAGGLAAYAAFALPLTMTALPINILLPDFYAQQTGLALSTIGLVLLATRLVDAVADPLLGTWVDRQKAGNSYLSPVLLACVPLVPGFLLLFDPPAAARAMPAVWLAATLVAVYLGYSLATVAYQAWGSELAHDDAGRARVTASREGAGLIGVLIGGSVPALAGFPALAGLFLVLLASALILLARYAPRPAPATRTPAAGNPFVTFLVPLASPRLRWLLAVFALNAVAPAITATVFQFYVADRLGLGDKSALFLALYFVAGAASMPLWSRLAGRLSLHAVWLIGMVAAVLSFVWAYGLGAGSFGAFAAICVLSGLAFGADLALPPALLARVIDANGHGGQREGAYFGLWNCVNKFCLALAAGLALPLLEALGYTRGATGAPALEALAIVYAVVPCLLKLAAAAVLVLAWRREKF